ncbi:MAG: hypothetical protein ACTHJ4_00975 [Candidatus Nucleicultricaceae bacterium]
MKKFLILLLPLFFTPLNASRIPTEIDEFASTNKQMRLNYTAFKDDVLKTIAMLKKLETFVKQDTWRIYAGLDTDQEKTTRETLFNIQAVLSNGPILHLIGNDQAIQKEIAPFYTAHMKDASKTESDDSEKVDQTTLNGIKELAFPCSKSFYLQTQSADSMHGVLDKLFKRYQGMLDAGSLVTAQNPVDIVDLRNLSRKMMRHTIQNFWWGEMLLVYHYKDKTSPLRGDWEQQALDWLGQGKSQTASQTDREISGLAETLRLQALNSFNALFLHQLSGFYQNGWSLKDLQIILPHQRTHLKAFEDKFLPKDNPSAVTPYVNFLDRLKEYGALPALPSNGVFAYDDAHNMLLSIEQYLEHGHAIMQTSLNLQAQKLVDELNVTEAWSTFQTVVAAAENRTSNNIFEQGRIQEKRDRYLRFDPSSMVTSIQESLEIKKQFTELLDNTSIQVQFRPSSFFSALAYRNHLSGILDLLVDSYTPAALSEQHKQEKSLIERLFRKLHLALQESDRQTLDHAFLFMQKYPGIFDENTTAQDATSHELIQSTSSCPPNTKDIKAREQAKVRI